tara:strand:+ start:837 stop:1133 length:297 start_codon:yes stop_codon:yes gene_type:complete
MLNKILTTHNQPSFSKRASAFGGRKIKVMEEVETITDEIVNASYTNAFDLLIGNTDFDTLSDQDEFYLPKDYDNVDTVLQYFEEIEDYDKCIQIRDRK